MKFKVAKTFLSFFLIGTVALAASNPDPKKPAPKDPPPASSGGSAGGIASFLAPMPSTSPLPSILPDPSPVSDPPVVQGPVNPSPIPLMPLKKIEPVQQTQIVGQPTLYVASDEAVHHTGYVETNASSVPTDMVSLSSLALQDLVWQNKGDVLVTQATYENNQTIAVTNERYHAQNEELYGRGAITKQAYEESRTRLVKSQGLAEESKGRWNEYQAEGVLYQLRLRQVRGETIAVVDLAKAYAQIWEARLVRARGSEAQARASLDYLTMMLDIDQRLQARDAVSETVVIGAEGDVQQAQIALKLASALVAGATNAVEGAMDSVRRSANQH